jgi:hypothetical protein
MVSPGRSSEGCIVLEADWFDPFAPVVAFCVDPSFEAGVA